MSQVEKNYILGGLVLALVIILLLIIFPRTEREPRERISLSPDFSLELSDFDLIDPNQSARLAIVVYENYLDPFSYQLLEVFDQAKQDFKDDLLFVYRPFVVDNHSLSWEAALLIICANQAGQGLAARQLLYSEGRNNFSLANLTDYADQLSLDEELLSSCLGDLKLQEDLSDWSSELKETYVIGSPTIFVNEEIIIGARPYHDFIDSNGDSVEGLRSVILRHLNK